MRVADSLAVASSPSQPSPLLIGGSSFIATLPFRLVGSHLQPQALGSRFCLLSSFLGMLSRMNKRKLRLFEEGEVVQDYGLV